MSSIFKRYPPPSRRAVFYAREWALNSGASEIDSIHLLSALTVDKTTRANTVLKLDEKFPEEAARLRAMTRCAVRRDIPLNREVKIILARAVEEANEQGSYWIDTDHLALAILREQDCDAAARLRSAGIQIEEARKQVEETADQREEYGPVPALWRLEKPISLMGRTAGILYLLLVVIMISLLTGRGC
jgi:ATP-dependent Clp protease ATP-binding subunit ClpA